MKVEGMGVRFVDTRGMRNLVNKRNLRISDEFGANVFLNSFETLKKHPPARIDDVVDNDDDDERIFSYLGLFACA